jgi:hypothetical protein
MFRELSIFFTALVVLAFYALAFTSAILTVMALLYGNGVMALIGPVLALGFFMAGRSLDRRMWGRGRKWNR